MLSLEGLLCLMLDTGESKRGTLSLEGLVHRMLDLWKERHLRQCLEEDCYPTLDLREPLPLMQGIEKVWNQLFGLEEFLYPMLETWRFLHLTWKNEERWCITKSMEELGHSMLELEELGYPTTELRRCWLPTLGLEKPAYSTWRHKATWYPTLGDGGVSCLTLTSGRVWEFMMNFEESWPHAWSKGSNNFHSSMIYLWFLQVYSLSNPLTHPYFLRTIVKQLLRRGHYNTSYFSHALVMHESLVSMVRTWPSSWEEDIEAAFHHGRLQTTKLKDSLKIICYSIPPFLEGKQFEKGGFVMYPLYYCN